MCVCERERERETGRERERESEREREGGREREGEREGERDLKVKRTSPFVTGVSLIHQRAGATFYRGVANDD